MRYDKGNEGESRSMTEDKRVEEIKKLLYKKHKEEQSIGVLSSRCRELNQYVPNLLQALSQTPHIR